MRILSAGSIEEPVSGRGAQGLGLVAQDTGCCVAGLLEFRVSVCRVAEVFRLSGVAQFRCTTEVHSSLFGVRLFASDLRVCDPKAATLQQKASFKPSCWSAVVVLHQ